MNNPVSPEDKQHQTTGEAPASPLGYLIYWPAIIAGLLIAMGIFSLGTNANNQFLVWIPPFVLGAFILLAILTYPRTKKNKEEYWEKRERENREKAIEKEAQKAALSSAQANPEGITASVQPVAEEKKAADPAPKAAAAPVVAGDVDVLIMWGSETGTAQGLAEMTEAKLQDTGVSARAVSMGNVTVNQLPGFKKVLVITSTWGDGEPPSNAIDIWEALQKEKVDLSNTRFSVLSLGDTAYPQFCKCGKDFDEFLASHGAQRMHPRVDCDLDYEANFEKWLSGVQKAM